ncbi:RrF2 family transcriptional regulator [Ferrimicrobium acidiphilum]|jgi:Rrf2 family protein|uniref:Rrf2 family transcriptional regulator n=2 Tax=Acidimicrobiaceae TaxID=84994 RepID=A0ABV3Y4N8_9ACTN|nr:Rrf2 family transcriptional regulator [Ferrimicrobium acidiphilum]
MSRRGDYSVRAALYLARQANRPDATKVKEIVAEMDIPASFASQILADLVRTDIATSKPGRDGGYRLARDPSSITLLELVEAGEGPLRAEHCALGEGPCRWDTVCPLHTSWQATVAAVREQLTTITLATILEEDLRLETSHEQPVDGHRFFRVLEANDSSYVELPLAAVEQLLGRITDRQLIDGFRETLQSLDALSSASLSMAYLLENGSRLIIELIGVAQDTLRLEIDLTPITIDARRVELKGHAKIRTNMVTDPEPLVRVILNRIARILEDIAVGAG